MEVSVGSVLEGNVKSITKFGAFVSLPGGRSGLVHISEIAYSYVNDVSEHLSEGQQVKVKVVGIDDAGRINLSIKKAQDPPPQAAGQGSGASRPPRQNFQSGSRPSAPKQNFESRGPQQTAPVRTAASAPAGNDFENMMKQFMQTSDSKLSSLRVHEKRANRRSGHK